MEGCGVHTIRSFGCPQHLGMWVDQCTSSSAHRQSMIIRRGSCVAEIICLEGGGGRGGGGNTLVKSAKRNIRAKEHSHQIITLTSNHASPLHVKRAGHTHWPGSVSRPCPPLVLLFTAPLNSVAGLCVQALSSSCPLWLGSVSRPCPPLVLCGWALWLVLASSCPCLGRAPELCGRATVSRLCVRVLSSSCPCLGRAPELCGWSLWPGLLERSVAEQLISDVNADKNSLM